MSDTYFSTSQINLYVPNNSLDKYSEAAVWKQFAPFSIFEFDSSKITEIEVPDSHKPKYYNLNGICISNDWTSLSPGMYIEIRSGKMRKIIIR